MWRASKGNHKISCTPPNRRSTPLFSWNKGSSWICPADTPKADWKNLWACFWGYYGYTRGETNTKTLYTACAMLRTKAWTHGSVILSNIGRCQKSCVQSTTSMPAIKIGPRKSQTKDWDMAKTKSTVSLSFSSIQVNSGSWPRRPLTQKWKPLHADASLCASRALATRATEKIWQHNLSHGCNL